MSQPRSPNRSPLMSMFLIRKRKGSLLSELPPALMNLLADTCINLESSLSHAARGEFDELQAELEAAKSDKKKLKQLLTQRGDAVTRSGLRVIGKTLLECAFEEYDTRMVAMLKQYFLDEIEKGDQELEKELEKQLERCREAMNAPKDQKPYDAANKLIQAIKKSSLKEILDMRNKEYEKCNEELRNALNKFRQATTNQVLTQPGMHDDLGIAIHILHTVLYTEYLNLLDEDEKTNEYRFDKHDFILIQMFAWAQRNFVGIYRFAFAKANFNADTKDQPLPRETNGDRIPLCYRFSMKKDNDLYPDTSWEDLTSKGLGIDFLIKACHQSRMIACGVPGDLLNIWREIADIFKTLVENNNIKLVELMEPVHTQSAIKNPFDGVKKIFLEFLSLPQIINHEKYNQVSKMINELMDDFDKIHNLKVKLQGKTQEEIKQNKELEKIVEFCDKLSSKVSSELNEYIKLKEAEVTIYFSGDKISLGDAFYTAALCLAKVNPINPVCSITQDKIDLENCVCTSDRYQFDVQGLYGILRFQSLETLVNPSTKVKFSERDKQTILKRVRQFAEQNNLNVVLFSGNHYPNGDPDHAATIALVQELTQGQNNNPVQPTIIPPQIQQQQPQAANPQQNQVGWRIDRNNWSLYDSGAEINRNKNYINNNPVHIREITLRGYNDGTFSIALGAGYTASFQINIFTTGYATGTAVDHNQQLIQALQNRGLNPNTANVTRFPNANDRHGNLFEVRGTLSELVQVLPTVLNCVGDLEGQNSIQTIQDEIVNSFQQLLSPGSSYTG